MCGELRGEEGRVVWLWGDGSVDGKLGSACRCLGMEGVEYKTDTLKMLGRSGVVCEGVE